MSILCDREIREAIKRESISISPYCPENLQPNSYDVTLGKSIIVDGVKRDLPYTLKHGEFILATTAERIAINRDCCAMVDGKSTPARHGICVHLTAGFIDCGFCGNITLEMVNFGRDYELREGMPIGQIVFFTSSTPDYPYQGHYQYQSDVTPAWDDKE